MMNYEEFKSYVVEHVNEYLPEGMKPCDVSISEVYKVNTKLDSLTIRPIGANISPSIYLDNYYERYRYSNNIESVLHNIVTMWTNAIEDAEVKIGMGAEKLEQIRNKEYVSKNVFFMFVNTEMNKDYLKEIPHREFLDLSIIYRVVVSKTHDGIASYSINNEFFSSMGFSEQELYDLARENTFRIFESCFDSLLNSEISILNDRLLEVDPYDPEYKTISDQIENLEAYAEDPIYVITNKTRLNGAIEILNSDFMEKVAEIMEDDFYIIPSSIHECLICPVSKASETDVLNMVITANKDAVDTKDILANSVYKYTRKTGEITLAATQTDLFGVA